MAKSISEVQRGRKNWTVSLVERRHTPKRESAWANLGKTKRPPTLLQKALPTRLRPVTTTTTTRQPTTTSCPPCVRAECALLRPRDVAQLTPMAALVSGEKSNFQYILRLLNTNVDGKQKVMYALTKIKGVGRRYSNLVCKKADVDLSKR